MRPDGRQAVADRILHRHRHRLRHARFRLDLALDSRRARCPADRCHLVQCRAVGDGPASRATCSSVDRRTTCRMPAFPFGRVKRITLAGAPVLALRVTYVGELGWELHIPVEFAATRLRRADGSRRAARHRQRRLSRHRVAAPGEGLPRLGCRYRARPLAAGRRPRLGREAKIEHSRFRGVPRSRPRPQASCHACWPGSPPIHRSCCSGARPSIATASAWAGSASGGYGYTVGRSIGYGYVRDPENGVDRASCAFRPLRARGRHDARARRNIP